MAKDKTFADAVVARLVPMGPVTWKRMFGGFGIYLDGLMFGLIADDALYFKVDDDNRPEFEAAGSTPFTFERKDRSVQTSYWRVPDDIYEDIEALAAWGGRAHQAALRNRAKNGPPRKSRRRAAAAKSPA